MTTGKMNYRQPWDLGDITFVVGEKHIYANKTTLVMSSDFFKAMFDEEFAENERIEIPLPDKKFDDFLELMQILHPQTLKSLDETNVHRILPLAHEYQMKGVFANCGKTLSAGPPSILSLNMMDTYDLQLPQLHKACMEYLVDLPLARIKTAPGYTELKPETLIEILDSKIKMLEPLKAFRDEVSKLTNRENMNDEECRGRFEEICQLVGKYR